MDGINRPQVETGLSTEAGNGHPAPGSAEAGQKIIYPDKATAAAQTPGHTAHRHTGTLASGYRI